MSLYDVYELLSNSKFDVAKKIMSRHNLSFDGVEDDILEIVSETDDPEKMLRFVVSHGFNIDCDAVCSYIEDLVDQYLADRHYKPWGHINLFMNEGMVYSVNNAMADILERHDIICYRDDPVVKDCSDMVTLWLNELNVKNDNM